MGFAVGLPVAICCFVTLLILKTNCMTQAPWAGGVSETLK